jgi:hypothetical protein
VLFFPLSSFFASLQLARYKALYADSARHERLLETQLEQYLIHSTVTTEFIEGSMNDMIYVSNQISTNQPIPVRKMRFEKTCHLECETWGSMGAITSARAH